MVRAKCVLVCVFVRVARQSGDKVRIHTLLNATNAHHPKHYSTSPHSRVSTPHVQKAVAVTGYGELQTHGCLLAPTMYTGFLLTRKGVSVNNITEPYT